MIILFFVVWEAMKNELRLIDLYIFVLFYYGERETISLLFLFNFRIHRKIAQRRPAEKINRPP